ncbi:MAG: S41 family peptidase [Clostridia bacterium]|nr:S41 family peptidase [Clostridia bacterium]
MRIILVVTIALAAAILSYTGFEAVSQHCWVAENQEAVIELTTEQKIKDFKYLTQLVREVSPFADLNVKAKKLDNISDLENEYIHRAGETKNNQEFYSLFKEYLTRINQTGHAYYLSYFENANSLNTFSLRMLYGIKKEMFNRVDYWRTIDTATQNYAYSPLKVAYKDGKYLLIEDFTAAGRGIPAGSMIVKINGLEVDDYVMSLQNKAWLRFDQPNRKLFIQDPFTINSAKERDGWIVEFVLKDGERYSAKIEKHLGYKAQGQNAFDKTFCYELREDVGYIRIFGFNGESELRDGELISKFMSQSQGKYKKLILDIRGNTGGSPSYWMKNLLQPLLKSPVEYKREAAVKKNFFNRLGWKFPVYQSLDGGLSNKKAYGFVSAKEIGDNRLEGEDWRYFEITRRFEPQNTFPFDGQVYILTDNNNFSSAEDFVGAMKTLKLGKVVGANTLGGAAAYIEPWLFRLPESGILFRMEVELTFNPGGKPDEIYGIKPDVELETSTYPTEYPQDYSKDALLKDRWIQWVLKD